jgi:CubicO group peptidase (beta-lactamase class C family)
MTSTPAQTITPASTTAPLSAAESDPVKLGWMVGSPPPADKVVRFSDGSQFRFPQTRWAFANSRQMVATRNVWRGDGPISVLPRAERDDIDAVKFVRTGSEMEMTWAGSLEANYTDAIVVLHKGRIVHERYFGVMKPHQPHIAMSVTKSLFGTVGAMLVAEGKLDPDALVPHYIPELKGSAYGDASVRNVLDMRIGIKYSENYASPDADIWRHARAGGVIPRPADYQGPQSFYDFLKTLEKEGEHGRGFFYKTVNADMVGWLICRATGEPAGDVFSSRIWQKLGAEQDAYIAVDSVGNEFAGGGFNAALRDMARFGEMMRLDGRFNGHQIVPKAVVDDIRSNGSTEAFAVGGGFPTLPGWAYRAMWWVTNNEHGAYAARGIHGQAIYIDPKAEMVIARFASHPLAANPNFDPTTLPAFHALAKHLMA